MSCVGVHIKRSDGIGCSVTRVEGVGVRVSMTCDTGRYLIVTPSFLWVTTEWFHEDIDVKSNTDWEVG